MPEDFLPPEYEIYLFIGVNGYIYIWLYVNMHIDHGYVDGCSDVVMLMVMLMVNVDGYVNQMLMVM